MPINTYIQLSWVSAASKLQTTLLEINVKGIELHWSGDAEGSDSPVQTFRIVGFGPDSAPAENNEA